MRENPARHAVNAHYGRDDLGETILEGLRASGKDPETISAEDLAPVDQLHIGARPATLELMRLAGIEAGHDVLDAGGGLGGPARTLATEAGCRVTVLDLTESFCRVGEMLTARTSLAGRVSFRHGDATAAPFADASFDVVWHQHCSMNIADKEALYAESWRLLRPGGRLAMHEILAGPNPGVRFPVPWAGEASLSFLRPVEGVRALIAESGFAEESWTDVSAEAIAWWRDRFSAPPPPGGPPPLGLHLIMGTDTQVRARNLMQNLEEDRVRVIRAVFVRR